jgi:soluble lytic murein transglycosylase
MRGTDHAYSRRARPRTLLGGLAAVLFFAHAAQAQPVAASTSFGTAGEAESAEETAFAIPRLAPSGSLAEVNLPAPLSPADAAMARRVFADQGAGRLAAAAREARSLDTDLLDGAIAADRYLGRFHRSTPAELRAWLARYGTAAEAGAIRALLARRLPRGAALPADRAPDPLPPEPPVGPAPDDLAAEAGGAIDPRLRRAVTERVHAREYVAALRLIEEARRLDPATAALLRAEVARALFTHNWDGAALQVAAAAWRESPPEQRAGRAALVAGLAAWRLGRHEMALGWFGHAAGAPVASASVHAAGAFWAARAALRQHDLLGYHAWLQRAAAERRTFHGLIARRILGWGTGLILGRELLSPADLDALAATPRGLRAFALLQVGQTARAEAELRALWPEVADSAPLRRALLLAAGGAHLTDLAAQLAGIVQEADGIPHDALRFPVPKLRPAGGFVVNSALVYGLTRTESNFDAAAVSPVGARGLMQLMPDTAREVSGNARMGAAALHDPALNLGLGQRVLLALSGLPSVHGDLIRTLASYNSGAAGYANWAADLRCGGDPLLFLEAIPVTETRLFVRRVLTNTWIYAARLGLPAPSLDDLAAGRWPQVEPAEDTPDTRRLANWTDPSTIPHARREQQFARSGS